MTNAIPPVRAAVAGINAYQQGKSNIVDCTAPVKLSSNESAYGPSPQAIAAYHAAAGALCRYPDGEQHQLRQAIADTLELDATRIVCGNGSEELIGLAVRAYVGRGDELLLSENHFIMCPIYGRLQDADIVLARENNFMQDVDNILARVTPRTRLVIIANPNNPTGTYLPATEVKRLHQRLPADALLLLDGAYAEYVTVADYDAGLGLVEQHDNVMVTRTFSKIHALPALRIGWAYCPPAVAGNLNKIRTPFNANTAAMAAAAAAIKDSAWADEVKQRNAAERVRVTDALRRLGLAVVPSMANFYLLCFDGMAGKSAAAAAAFLEGRNIITRPVGGGHDTLRITLGLEQENTQVIAALTAYMQS